MLTPDLTALIDAVREDIGDTHLQYSSHWFIVSIKEVRAETECSLLQAVQIVRCYVYVKHLEGDVAMVRLWESYDDHARMQALAGLFGDT